MLMHFFLMNIEFSDEILHQTSLTVESFKKILYLDFCSNYI